MSRHGQQSSGPPNYNVLDSEACVAQSRTVDALSDGRITVNLDSKLARALTQLIDLPDEYIITEPPPTYTEHEPWVLPMNIVIQVVGSRGDIQPFVALGNELQKSGHRVRLATHNVFKSFVMAAGLEFFPIGGNPADLMAYMVRNPGLIPSMKTLRDGEIQRTRAMIGEMLHGCWRSCIEPDPDSNIPFVANAIIANPPSFAHVHCAQALSIPLHIIFTMPWSPTRAFPHPLANLQNSSTDPKLANYLSYGLVQMLTWQGLGDVTNEFRKTIDLPVLPSSEAPFVAETLRIPHTYCWSPSLVPKPTDWADHIDVCGFIFRESPVYQPPPALETFLQDGPPPVYIGFGSIVVDNPQGLLRIVLGAVQITGVRAIISKGWSQLNTDEVPSSVFFVGDCPHEWLFQHVAAVVHHGGAGTCAAGLVNGRPTAIIPFFGDQPFWGDRVAVAGAGPVPIPHKKLTIENLSEAINFCLTSEAAQAANKISENMQQEHGFKATVDSFHRHLSIETLRCDVQPHLPAVYEVALGSKVIKISAPVADILIKHDKVKAKQLKLYEATPIAIDNRRWDPVTASGAVSLRVAFETLASVNDIWYAPYKMRRQAQAYDTTRAEAGSSIVSKSSTSLGGSVCGDRVRKVDSRKGPSVGQLVGASAMSVPKVFGTMVKGLTVDTPLAAAEGLRNVPRMYGEKVSDHGAVVDIKSGMMVGVQEFGKGIGRGAVDIFVQPYKGAKKDGALGFVSGIGKGVVGSLTKMGSGGMAIWSYPAQGIWRSIYDATHSKTKKQILNARILHDSYHARRDAVDEGATLCAFEGLRNPYS